MTNWKYTIKLEDLWGKGDEMSFEEQRDAIVARIKSSVPYKRAVRLVANDSDGDNYWDHEMFTIDVDDLAASRDEHEFDMLWQGIYDYADKYKIWIATVA